MRYDTDNLFSAFQVLLNHGVDLKKRDAYGDVLAFAADRRCWRAMLALIHHGVDRKNSQYKEKTLAQILAEAVAESRQGGMTASADLPKVIEKIEPTLP